MMRRITRPQSRNPRRRRVSVPSLRRDVGLPDALNSIIPSCAQSCVTAFLASEFAPLCPSTRDLDCLCSNTISSGYTLGEVALACTDSHCTAPSDDIKATAYRVCDGQLGAVQPTHSVLTLSTPTVSPMPASSTAGTAGSPGGASSVSGPGPSDTVAQSVTTTDPTSSNPSSSNSTGSGNASASTKSGGLSTGTAAGISIAVLVIAAAMAYAVWYIKCHKKRKHHGLEQPLAMRERDRSEHGDDDEDDDNNGHLRHDGGHASDVSDDEMTSQPVADTDFLSAAPAPLPQYRMRGALDTIREDATPIATPVATPQTRYHVSNQSPMKPSPVELDSHEIMHRQPQKPAPAVRRNESLSMSERARQDTLRAINPRKPPPPPFTLKAGPSDSESDGEDKPSTQRRSNNQQSAVLTPMTPNFRNVKTSDLSPVSALDRDSMAPAAVLPPPGPSDIDSLPSRASSSAAREMAIRTASQRSTRKPAVRFDSSQSRPPQATPAPGQELLPSKFRGYPEPAQPAVPRPGQDDTPITEEEDEDLKPAPLTPKPRASVVLDRPFPIPAFPQSLQGPAPASLTDASSESGESRDTTSQASDADSRRARSSSRSSEGKSRSKVSKVKPADGGPTNARVRRKAAPSENGSVTSEASLILSAEQRAERERRRQERREKRKAQGKGGERSASSSSKTRRRRRDLESEGSVISETSSTQSREARGERLRERAARSQERAKGRSSSRSSERTKALSSSGVDREKTSSSASSSAAAPRKRKESRSTDDLYENEEI